MGLAGAAAFVDNGKLIFNDNHFDKGDAVLVNHLHLPTSRGTIQNINNSEASPIAINIED